MDFGLHMPFRNPPIWHRPYADLYAEHLTHIERAEELGYDTVWLTEHHFSEDGYSPSLIPIASAIAARTQRIRIGTAVLLTSFHHALRLAEDAALVDILSNGRFDLGLGAGYGQVEFDGYGVRMSDRDRKSVV